MAKVFSIVDFKEGLDVRKTPLTAPGGSLRILENAVLNQGGEIEKRLAFVPWGSIPGSPPYFLSAQAAVLHSFGFDAKSVPGTVYHQLTGLPEAMSEILD